MSDYDQGLCHGAEEERATIVRFLREPWRWKTIDMCMLDGEALAVAIESGAHQAAPNGGADGQ